MPAYVARRSSVLLLVFLVSSVLAVGALSGAAGLPPSDRCPGTAADAGSDERESQQSPQKRGKAGFVGGGRVYKAQISPNWFANNTRFWYRNDLRGGAKEFIVVDAERGTREPAFDHEKLAGALSKAASTNYEGRRLPFDSIEFLDDKSIRFTAGGTTWKCDLASYECSKMRSEPEASATGSLQPVADASGSDKGPRQDGDFPDAPWAGELGPDAEQAEA